MTHFDIFADPILFRLGPLPVTRSMATSAAVSAALIMAAAVVRVTLQRRPASFLATAGEIAFEWLDKLVTDVVGRPAPWLVAFSGSLFLFIAACNVSGQLPGVHPPTANLAVTSALACTIFLAVPAAGIASLGIGGYFGRYFQPNPILFPLHLITEVSRTFALSMRLFGNMMSGHLIVALLVVLSGVLIPTPLMALDLLIGLLQAYIFTLLSTIYIAAALRTDET